MARVFMGSIDSSNFCFELVIEIYLLWYGIYVPSGPIMIQSSPGTIIYKLPAPYKQKSNQKKI